jgi:Zn-dependent peptidase ImmA (M78 family)
MRPLGEVDAVDAFSVVIVDRPIIVTTPRRSEDVFRHRFSIAHEIGDLLLHADSCEHSAAIEKERRKPAHVPAARSGAGSIPAPWTGSPTRSGQPSPRAR